MKHDIFNSGWQEDIEFRIVDLYNHLVLVAYC